MHHESTSRSREELKKFDLVRPRLVSHRQERIFTTEYLRWVVTIIGHLFSFLEWPSLHETPWSQLSEGSRPLSLTDGLYAALAADRGPTLYQCEGKDHEI